MYRWLLECGPVSKFIRFMERIHKVHFVERETSKDICGPGGDWQKFKQLPDLRMFGLKYGPKLGKPLKREKSKSGKLRCQNSTMLGDWEAFISSIRKKVNVKKPSKTRKLEVTIGNPVQERNKAKLPVSGNWSEELWIQQDSKDKLCMYRGGAWERLESFLLKKSWRSYRSQMIWFNDSLQLGSQVYSYASSDENTGCERCSGQGMEEARNDASRGFGIKSRARRRLFWNHKETNIKSTLLHLMDTCHLKHAS